MKRFLLLILILIIGLSAQCQNELSDKERIKLLEERVSKLESYINQSKKNPISQPGITLNSTPVNISRHTPIDSKGNIVPYESFDRIKTGMLKNEVTPIMGEPYDIKKSQSGKKISEDWYYKKGGGNTRSVIHFLNGIVTKVYYPKVREDYPANYRNE